MPSPLELDFYELGLRVSQCQILFKRSVDPATRRIDHIDQRGWCLLDEAGVVDHSIELLESILEDLANKLAASRSQRKSHVTALKFLRQVYENWRGGNAVSEPHPDKVAVKGIFVKIKSRALLWVPPVPEPLVNCWLELGCRICEGDWVSHSSGADTYSPLKYRNDLDQAWEWGSWELLQDYLAEVNGRLESLCPPVPANELRIGRAGLPYNQTLDAMWLRVEIGLQNLRPSDHNEKQSADARHSGDFRSVNWFGKLYEFSKPQAACVKILWEHWENGTPLVGWDYLSAEAEIVDTGGKRDKNAKMSVVFRGSDAWGTMIVMGNTQGSLRLSGKFLPPRDPSTQLRN